MDDDVSAGTCILGLPGFALLSRWLLLVGTARSRSPRCGREARPRRRWLPPMRTCFGSTAPKLLDARDHAGLLPRLLRPPPREVAAVALMYGATISSSSSACLSLRSAEYDLPR